MKLVNICTVYVSKGRIGTTQQFSSFAAAARYINRMKLEQIGCQIWMTGEMGILMSKTP